MRSIPVTNKSDAYPELICYRDQWSYKVIGECLPGPWICESKLIRRQENGSDKKSGHMHRNSGHCHCIFGSAELKMILPDNHSARRRSSLDMIMCNGRRKGFARWGGAVDKTVAECARIQMDHVVTG